MLTFVFGSLITIRDLYDQRPILYEQRNMVLIVCQALVYTNICVTEKMVHYVAVFYIIYYSRTDTWWHRDGGM